MAQATVITTRSPASWVEPAYTLVREHFPDAAPEFCESLTLTLMAAKFTGIPDLQLLNGIMAIFTVGLPEIE